MPQAKHGKYDAATGLPDNTGQPNGSGSIVWFHEQIRERLPDTGQALIDASRTQGDRRTAWLREQLVAQGQADLVDAYQARVKADRARDRRRDKERKIARIQATLARNDIPFEHQEWLRKELAKAQKYLDDRPLREENHVE